MAIQHVSSVGNLLLLCQGLHVRMATIAWQPVCKVTLHFLLLRHAALDAFNMNKIYGMILSL